MTQQSTIHAARPEDPVPDEFDVLCEKCAYSLIGLHCDRCPECGHPFDYTELPLARVPWLYRRRIGRSLAYRRTWKMIISSPRAFAAELCRPVRISQEDARQFRRRTIHRVVFTAMFVAAAIIAWIVWYESKRGMVPTPAQQPEPYAVATAGYLGGALALWIFLSLATDLPTFIWRGLDRNPRDLAPLHHYACAPLALVPYAMLVIGIMGAIASEDKAGFWAAATFYSTCACLLFLTILMWMIPLMLMRAATGCSWRQTVWLALYLPFHWSLIALLSLLIVLGSTLPTSLYFSRY
jgi:hypothetical protein